MSMPNLAQLRRMVLISTKKDAEGNVTKEALEITADELGQDTLLTLNIAPRKMTRSSQVGTTERPIPGTFDAFAATISFLMDNYRILGQVMRNWVAATYAGATKGEGQITDQAGSFCDGDQPLQIIMQGVCDDGSAVDAELTRCLPSLDGDLEFGGSETSTATVALNPQIYNPGTYEGDGLPPYSYRLGVQSTTKKTRLDVATGEYVEVTVTTQTVEIDGKQEVTTTETV